MIGNSSRESLLELVGNLRKNHSGFDVLWNEVGRETQEHMVKTAPELLTRLGEWYNSQLSLITEMDDSLRVMESVIEEEELV